MILTLPEQFKLLSLKNKENKYISINSVSACLFQLIISHKIELSSNKENLILKNSLPTHKDYLDIIINHMNHENPKTFNEWVQYFYINSYITAKINLSILDSLVDKQILKKKEKDIFFFFKRKRYVDYLDVQNTIIKNLKEDLLYKKEPNENYVVLSLLLESNNLLDKFFINDSDLNKVKNIIFSFHKRNEYEILKLCKDSISEIDFIKSSSISLKNSK